MNKLHRSFEFRFPLKHKLVRDLRIVTAHIGDLVVEGVGYFNPSASPIDIYDRYSVDIEFIRWNGVDIKPVLEVIHSIEDIEEAAVRYFANYLENDLDRAA